MFGSKKAVDNTVTNSTHNTGATNSIVQGTIIEGVIRANNDIRVDGSLNGELFCEGRVIIGKEGYVDGEIKCENAIVEGKFNGKLVVTDTLQVKDTANIKGDVQTGNLVVQAGAKFDVSCGMGSQKIKNINEGKDDQGKLKNANA